MKKILIANRGEIASRIIRTCKKLGIQTIAVYSDADKSMPYVSEADHSFRIGEPPVNKSYLNMEGIIEVAAREGAEGIHPGYGLLSENAEFARKVTDAGITFIGPEPETIRMMGDKIRARQKMKEAGVPVVPGTDEGIASIEEAVKAAKEIGYPIMVKASGGGGGIGMVRCENEQALNQHFEQTRKRAQAYFGSDEIFIEKCIDHARHVEVQIFGDRFGNQVHLFERNCSVQRRNQKVVEEAVSPALSMSTQEEMYKAALRAAEATGYQNAGTVEFIVDEDENFYFLEMNTRLQVEHPVTEAITGFDLVEWQIKAAKGERLPKIQEDIQRNGHSIEMRIYAEDPATFYPSPGNIAKMKWGAGNVRVDTGYSAGSPVSPFYDPMIAKCIVHGPDREECIYMAQLFLKETEITGIKTNIPYLLKVMKDPAFRQGNYTTGLLGQLLIKGEEQ
ncbi:MAG TPA: acetyl-CoA carboxylase biotin carboxylase subunit [Bacillaceae bacterium]